MDFLSTNRSDERAAASGLKCRDHFLRVMAMLADQNVNVIVHDRAGVTGVVVLLDRNCKRSSQRFDVSVLEREQLKLQHLLGLFVKSLQVSISRLDLLAAIVEGAEFRNRNAGN